MFPFAKKLEAKIIAIVLMGGRHKAVLAYRAKCSRKPWLVPFAKIHLMS